MEFGKRQGAANPGGKKDGTRMNAPAPVLSKSLTREAAHVMKSAYQIARVFGIPVKVHLSLIVLLPLIALSVAGSLFWGLIAAAGLFLSVALHEVGHSLVAMRKGGRVREILLLPIGGMARLERLSPRPRDEIRIAAAGPAVSGVLALLFFALALGASWIGLGFFTAILFWLAAINLMLALFNLLPSFPMDGGRIFRAWLTPRKGRVEATRVAAALGRGMAILFGIAGLWTGAWVLVAIAVFVYISAGAEYRLVRARENARRVGGFPGFGPPPSRVEEVAARVGPPPYEAPRADHDR